jgi:hypothetical protein
MAARIPFDFTLIDKRHQAFVEGRRDTFLTFLQVIGSARIVRLTGIAVVTSLIFYWGSRSLIYDFSVKWLTAEAVITAVTPVQKGDHFNWWYWYTFKTGDGKNAQGKIVLEDRNRFAIGERVPVVYVQSDPSDNRYANDPLPRSVRDWFFVGLSIFLLGSSAFWLREDLAYYRSLRRLARIGQPLPGHIVKAQFAGSAMDPDIPVEIDYTFKAYTGDILSAKARLALVHIARRTIPEPGTAVAVWHAAQEGSLLI